MCSLLIFTPLYRPAKGPKHSITTFIGRCTAFAQMTISSLLTRHTANTSICYIMMTNIMLVVQYMMRSVEMVAAFIHFHRCRPFHTMLHQKLNLSSLHCFSASIDHSSKKHSLYSNSTYASSDHSSSTRMSFCPQLLCAIDNNSKHFVVKFAFSRAQKMRIIVHATLPTNAILQHQ